MTDGKEPISPLYWDERNSPSFKLDGEGLSKLEYFSILLLAADVSNGEIEIHHKERANNAVLLAKYLIESLNEDE